MKPRSQRIWLALGFVAVAAVGVGLLTGSGVPSGGPSLSAWLDPTNPDHAVLVALRLPRVANGLAVGALLGMAGALLQVLLRNPLAEPYVLGLSGGAALGALAALQLGLADVFIGVFSGAGAAVSLLILLVVAQREFRGSAPVGAGERLILSGVMLAATWGALITLALSLSPDSQIDSMIFWLMGDLTGRAGNLWPWALVGVVALSAGFDGSRLNLLARGEDEAATLGVRVGALKLRIVVLSALAAGTAVAVAGPIGFVGLLAPHLLRSLCGTDQRVTVPGSALLGGALVVLADAVARSVLAPQQLPVGAVTALLGAPIFLVFLWRGTR